MEDKQASGPELAKRWRREGDFRILLSIGLLALIVVGLQSFFQRSGSVESAYMRAFEEGRSHVCAELVVDYEAAFAELRRKKVC